MFLLHAHLSLIHILNSYKEKQMRRRINTLITKNHIATYDEYVALIKKDKEKFEQFINFLTRCV